MKNIFISGIHGVGKTTLAKELSKKLELQHYACSSLINNYIDKTDENKRVTNIQENQRVLINAYKNLASEHTIILDGHVTLLDDDGNPTPIKSSVFRELDIGVFVLVVDDVDEILERLQLRDNLKWNVRYIKEMKSCEKKTIEMISRELNIELIEYKFDSDIDKLALYLKEFFC
ncbi:ATP-binding protein [Vibrio parahaemolyticus]|nr:MULTISPECIES: ATP-binding protein [Vibrio]ASG06513.1 AAA family ATPase [Vibrio anguillarum]EGQ8939598.1 AAA family ATPase [Vibrio parahaemolyticus]EGQ8949202.1 AAA family ATPase [Vibrio parahaemolyticus]EGQ8969785.1 AAA family ATPase [Vibrio parahaemolyticus]EGQ9118430.1 hypothetical protein [Vibrio parahaemolyticus]